MERLNECLEFCKSKALVKMKPGSKVDVLDINNYKWQKGEVLKRTCIANRGSSDTSLLYVEYHVDGSKNVGYYKADSMLLAPEGYFSSN